MKHQYVGDINDYLKYSILRRVSADHVPRLVVCWMLTPADGRSDGGLVAYLQQPDRYRHIDPDAFDVLMAITQAPGRSIDAVEQSRLLPNACFYSHDLLDRADARRQYLAGLDALVQPQDLVFFDPDNGFEVQSVPRGAPKSSKYLYWDEWARIAARGCSLCVYQHFPRVAREPFVARLFERAESVAPQLRSFCLQTSRVAYLFSVREEQFEPVLQGLRECEDAWRPHLRLLEGG